nr:MAG TPA_asm: hypothetical protein [Caudoviricetes sp.]
MYASLLDKKDYIFRANRNLSDKLKKEGVVALFFFTQI